MLYTLLSSTIRQGPHNAIPEFTELWRSTNDNAVPALEVECLVLAPNFLTYLEHSTSLSITYIIYTIESEMSSIYLKLFYKIAGKNSVGVTT